jgi:hypothetical protein
VPTPSRRRLEKQLRVLERVRGPKRALHPAGEAYQPYFEVGLSAGGLFLGGASLVVSSSVVGFAATVSTVGGGAYFAAKGLLGLADRQRHGQSNNPFTEPEARRHAPNVLSGSLAALSSVSRGGSRPQSSSGGPAGGRTSARGAVRARPRCSPSATPRA